MTEQPTVAEPSAYLATLASFVPAMMIREANEGMGAPTEARLTQGRAAALFVDVAGFTALTETLAARGAAGAEHLTELLNRYLGQLIDAVTDRGGDIVKFAGDALIALWPAEDGAGLRGQALRAAACARDIQARLNDYEVAEGFRLRVKLSIGAGSVWAERLGGVFDRWELLIAGDAVRQLGAAADHARPGDVTLSAEARALLADVADGEALPDGCLRLHALDAAPGPAAPFPTPLPHGAAAMRAFIPAAVRSRLDKEEVAWLGELRRISVLFVNLPDFAAETPLARAQEAMRAVQLALYRFEGSINKMSVDDKGASLIAAYGLPPFAHGDDPERAVRAAGAVRAALAELGFRAWVGVTTGVVFCGVVGNGRRREYTIMGDAVNLAARLMQVAGGFKGGPPVPGGVLACGATRAAAAATLAFEALPPVRVKGKAEPVAIFRPAPEAAPSPEGASARRRVRVVGRVAERAALAEMLDRLSATRAPQRLILLGEAGMGKSRLVQEAARLAAARGVPAAVGGGDPIETATPFRAWRQVFESLLASGLRGDDEARRAGVLARLPADATVLRDAPLLEAVLPWGWVDNDFTRPLAGEARARRTRALLTAVIRAAAERRGLLLAVQDAQWLDSASLALLAEAMALDAPLAVIASARPFDDAPPAEWSAALAAPGVATMALGPLDADAVAELCRMRLGVATLPPTLTDFVAERCEGNPAFAEELLFSLRDAGVVEIDGGTARIAAGREDPAGWRLPATIEGLVAGRIDRLRPEEQMTMKVASVIGVVFAREALARIHPAGTDAEALERHCETLAALELTPPVRSGSLLSAAMAERPAWKFKTNLLKDVAYDRMLYSQRRTLHRRMAEWLEGEGLGGDVATAPLLAMHWRNAAEDRTPEPEAALKAVDYFAVAARGALRLHALGEAIGFWREALALLGRLPQDEGRDRRELALQLELGPALVAAGSFAAPEVEAAFDQARALCDAVGEHAQLFRALRGLWQVRIGQAAYADALSLAETLLALSDRVGDAATRLEAHRALGTTAFWTGDMVGARRHLGRAVALHDPAAHAGLARLYGQDPCVAARGLLAWTLAFLGDDAAARAEANEAERRAATLDHPFSFAYALGARMWTGFFLGDRALAAEAGRRCAELSLERGFPYLAAAGRVAQGWGARDVDGVAAAVTGWRSAGGIGLAIFLLVQASLQVDAGRPAEALATLADPALRDRRDSEPWLTGLYHGLHGEALAAAGDMAAARAAQALAEQTARRQGARLLRGRAAAAAGTVD